MKKLITLITCISIFTSCSNMNNNNSCNEKMAANKTQMQRFMDEVINAHNVDMIDSFCTTDFVNHNPDPGHSGVGNDDLKASFREFFGAFPDVRVSTNYMIAEGDTVMAHMTMTGTNSGAMGPNMPATNKKFSMDGVDVIAIKDGKATQRWGFFDSMKMMTDLGMMGGAPPDTTKPAEVKK